MSGSATQWTSVHQFSLSLIISQNSLKFMFIESVILSKHFISCHILFLPSIFPRIRVWSPHPMSQYFSSGCQIIGASASALVFPVNIQGWFPLGLTDSISLLSKGLSRIFSITTFWRHQFFGTQLSFWSNSHIHAWLLEKP